MGVRIHREFIMPFTLWTCGWFQSRMLWSYFQLSGLIHHMFSIMESWSIRSILWSGIASGRKCNPEHTETPSHRLCHRAHAPAGARHWRRGRRCRRLLLSRRWRLSCSGRGRWGLLRHHHVEDVSRLVDVQRDPHDIQVALKAQPLGGPQRNKSSNAASRFRFLGVRA